MTASEPRPPSVQRRTSSLGSYPRRDSINPSAPRCSARSSCSCPATYGDHPCPRDLRDAHEHQADGAQPDHCDGVAGPHPRFVNALEHARQWFRKSGLTVVDMVRQPVGIGFHDAAGNPDELSERPVDKEQVLAEVLLVTPTVEALVAGRRVRSDNPVADLEPPDGCAGCHDVTGQFMAEGRRQRDHLGVVPPEIDLQVRSAGQGGTDPDQDVGRTDRRDRDPLQAQVLLPVEDSGDHLAAQLRLILAGERGS